MEGMEWKGPTAGDDVLRWTTSIANEALMSNAYITTHEDT